MNYKKIISHRILRKLPQFHEMNFHDPLVVSSINATALIELADIQDANNEFDGDVKFDYDPEPVLLVTWWVNGPASQGVEMIKFRFDPPHVDDDDWNKQEAYDRAMSIV